MVWTNLLTSSTVLPFLPSKGWNFGGSYPLGYGLPRSSGGNGGSRENCLGIPKVFPFLAPRGHWHLLALGTGGWFPLSLPTLPLVGSYLGCPQGGVVPDLLCLAFFEKANLSLQIFQHCNHLSHGVQLLSCVPLLWHDLLLCQGTLPLCLEVTSFSPTGSKAADVILASLLFLGLGGMLCEGIVSSLSFTQSPVESPKCESAFFFSIVAQGS